MPPFMKPRVESADQGLLHLHILGDVQAMVLPSGRPLECILAVPEGRHREFVDLLARIDNETQSNNKGEFIGEQQWLGPRVVVSDKKARPAE